MPRQPSKRRPGRSGAPPYVAEPAPPSPKPAWFQRLRSGLSLSSTSIGRGITDVFTKRKLDAEFAR